jgi:hypothetical protein
MKQKEIYSFSDRVRGINARGRRIAAMRDQYIQVALDGKPRTSQEVRDILGVSRGMKITSFLRTLKFHLLSERTGLSLKLTKHKGKSTWQLEERRFDNNANVTVSNGK